MEINKVLLWNLQRSLNPYYNGRYSWSITSSMKKKGYSCLNPYYNGRYSWRQDKCPGLKSQCSVLILIIMEDTHGDL